MSASTFRAVASGWLNAFARSNKFSTLNDAIRMETPKVHSQPPPPQGDNPPNWAIEA
jgi:hypothetical protein